MPQLSNIAVIFVVTFVVFPGVAASWAPQLEFFTSKGTLELKKAVGKCKLEVWGSSIFIFYTHGRYSATSTLSLKVPQSLIEPVFFESGPHLVAAWLQVASQLCLPTFLSTCFCSWLDGWFCQVSSYFFWFASQVCAGCFGPIILPRARLFLRTPAYLC